VKLNVLELPTQIVEGDVLTLIFGGVLTTIVNVAVSAQPFPLSSLTTTLYVVVVAGLTVNGPAPVPRFGVHVKVYGVVPPLAEALI